VNAWALFSLFAGAAILAVGYWLGCVFALNKRRRPYVRRTPVFTLPPKEPTP
jgi:hypothetical protein